jgi:MOSC domain-containing protein YiiM
MHVLSVNIGLMQTQPKGHGLETTGIYKRPAAETVEIGFMGIAGDFIGDLENHGGPDQAIYVYGAADYAWWSNALGRPLAPGTFGENLTVSDLQSAEFSVGDRLQIGSALLEVTAPRTPCGTLARRMGDALFVRKYRQAERPGLYCRVLRQGAVRAGDAVHLETRGEEAVAVLNVFRQHFARDVHEADLRHILRAPVAARVRADLERSLQRLQSIGS